MPSGFGTGLAEGLVGGFIAQKEKQDALKRDEQKQEIERYLKIATSADMPDDTREWAWGQYQQISQGKKPGSKASPLNPVLKRLGQMVGLSHGSGQPEARQAGAQQQPSPAPAVPAMQVPPQPQPPSAAQGMTAQPVPGMVGVSYADLARPAAPTYRQQLENRIRDTRNPFARHTAQQQLDVLNRQMELEQARGESQQAVADIRADAVRETARLRKEQAEELRRIQDSDAKDKVKLTAELRDKHDKELEDLRAKHRKELEEVQAKDREALKKTIPGRAAASSAPDPKVDERTNEWHARESRQNTQAYNRAVAAASKLAGRAKQDALNRARIELDKATEKTEAEFKRRYLDNRRRQTAGGGRVDVISPAGKPGTIPQEQLDEALAQGYKLAPKVN